MAQRVPPQRVAAMVPSAATVTLQRVTMNVTDAPLVAVIRDIAHQAGLVAAYDEAIMPHDARVTIHLKNVSVEVAFQEALRGTGLVAFVRPPGGVVVTRDNGVSIVVTDVITGVVTDARTKRPIGGAIVLVDNQRPGVESNERGTFHLSNVPAG
jgi:hypothetical protein